MLIKHDILRRVEAGEVTAAFRRWRRPGVRPGTTLRTVVGLIEVVSLEEVEEAFLTDGDACAAGFQDLEELRRSLRGHPGVLYRIGLAHAGPDPRRTLRDRLVDEEAYRGVMARLERLDAASRRGPWTRETLLLIAEHPEVRAADLAAAVGREKKPFKLDVRKLKELGLTESLSTGYRLSPRGRSVVARWTR